MGCVAVVPKAHVPSGATPASLYFGRFDKDEPGSTSSEPAGIHKMPISGIALYRSILVHGSHDNSVF